MQESQLLSTLNKGVLELKKKNLIAQTQYKWLGDFDSDSIDIKQVELANKVVFSISVIVVFFSIWNYTIAQKVNIKTRELSESEEKLRLIVNSIQSGIVVLEDESTIVACNDAMSKLIGVDQEALLGNTYRTIEPLKPFMKPENINQSFKLGNAYYYVTKRPFSERKTLVVIEDYTEKHIHEMRVRQEEKMIAVGQLSAGLAHEIRNPLGLIKSYSYIIEKYCEGAIEKHAITVINDSVRRINTLIESLLRFSKLSNNALKLIDIESLLQDIVLLVERTVDLKGIKIAYKTRGEKTKTVVVNEDVLKMVLLNLINNSIDSFKSVEKPNKAIEVVITVLASELRIMVKDNGCGIEKDVQENIFNPFYSTKETGVGLGLYIISTEIAHHEGVITVDSELGIGTEFNIVLPIKER